MARRCRGPGFFLLIALAGLACGSEPVGPGLRVLAEGLDVPESVVHDVARDRYLVSCVGGRPDARDGDGTLVAVDPGSGQLSVFARGLDGPKGLALAGDVVVVADITRLVAFRLADGARVGEHAIEGARFLNDVAVDDAGRLAVSDTQAGLVHLLRLVRDAGSVRFEPEASWPAPAPNGVAWEQGAPGPSRLLVASWEPAQLGRLGPDGSFRPLAWAPGSEPEPGFDGLLVHGGRWYVTNWGEGSLAWVAADEAPAGGARAQRIAERLETPADLGVDATRGLLLVPSFEAGRLYTLPIPAPAGP